MPDGLGAGAAEGHGDVFGAGGEVVEDAAHGADGEGGGDDELGEGDTGDRVGEGDEFLDALADGGLEEDQQAEADDHGGEDDGDIECGIDEGAAGESGAGHQVSYGDGDDERGEGGEGAGDERETGGVADFAGDEDGPDLGGGGVGGGGAEHESPEEEVGGADEAECDPERTVHWKYSRRSWRRSKWRL